MVDEDITRSIYDAAAHNDVKRLHALSLTFPDQFEKLKSDDLLKVAHEAKSPEAVLYLILHHHCLMPVSAALEIDRELVGEPHAQMHRTLEVFAEAAAWKYKYRSNDLYTAQCCSYVDRAARQAGTHDLEAGILHPYVLQAAVDGTLKQWFISLQECEERGGFKIGRHSGNMLRALEANFHYFASAAPKELIPMHLRSIGEEKDTNPQAQTLPPR